MVGEVVLFRLFSEERKSRLCKNEKLLFSTACYSVTGEGGYAYVCFERWSCPRQVHLQSHNGVFVACCACLTLLIVAFLSLLDSFVLTMGEKSNDTMAVNSGVDDMVILSRKI